MKIYRQVKCSDRLPSENIYCHTKEDYCVFINGEFIELYNGYVINTEWWLEEIELPNDDEVHEYAEEHAFSNAVKLGANFILNKLKNG